MLTHDPPNHPEAKPNTSLPFGSKPVNAWDVLLVIAASVGTVLFIACLMFAPLLAFIGAFLVVSIYFANLLQKITGLLEDIRSRLPEPTSESANDDSH